MRVLGMLTAGIAAALAGCAQVPAAKPGSDQRPQISFRFAADDARMQDARVVVDGADAGRLGDFADGRGALKVERGVRIIKVVTSAGVALDVRTHLGDGVTRPFTVREPAASPVPVPEPPDRRAAR